VSYDGNLKFIAVIEAPAVIKRILTHLEMHARFTRLTVCPSRDRLPFAEAWCLKFLYRQPLWPARTT